MCAVEMALEAASVVRRLSRGRARASAPFTYNNVSARIRVCRARALMRACALSPTYQHSEINATTYLNITFPFVNQQERSPYSTNAQFDNRHLHRGLVFCFNRAQNRIMISLHFQSSLYNNIFSF